MKMLRVKYLVYVTVALNLIAIIAVKAREPETGNMLGNFLPQPLPQITDSLPLSRNSIYVEFLGTGPLLSINYDRALFTNHDWSFTWRIGTIGWNEDFILDDSWVKTRTLVSSLSLLLKGKIVPGKFQYCYEMALGHSSVWKDAEYSFRYHKKSLIKPPYSAFYNISAGVRKQPIKRGLMIKVSYSLLFLTKPVDIWWDTYRLSILPWGGICIGYSF